LLGRCSKKIEGNWGRNEVAMGQANFRSLIFVFGFIFVGLSSRFVYAETKQSYLKEISRVEEEIKNTPHQSRASKIWNGSIKGRLRYRLRDLQQALQMVKEAEAGYGPSIDRLIYKLGGYGVRYSAEGIITILQDANGFEFLCREDVCLGFLEILHSIRNQVITSAIEKKKKEDPHSPAKCMRASNYTPGS
jgi:hypothetical protein